MAIQICLGGIYAWSALVPALVGDVGLSIVQTQVIFGCLFGTFTVSMVAGGRLLARFGPRATALAGGGLFGGGYLIASCSGGSLPLMLVGVSLLAGMGTGFAYVCPLATCMRWFPRKAGFVTGVSVAGFGGGAVVLSALAENMLSGGAHVLTVFQWIGFAYGAALLAAAAVLRFPATNEQGRELSAIPLRILLRDPFFLSLALGMFSGTFAGMLVIGNLKPMALNVGIPAFPAAAAVSVFALGNAAGRITWGWISDRTDERTIPVKLAAMLPPLALLAWANTSALFIGAAFAVGFCFGGCFVVYAAQVASRYGVAHVGAVYPIVFLAYGVAGIAGPPIGGWLFDTMSSYAPALAQSCLVVGIGFLGSMWLLQKGKRYGQIPE